MSTPGSDSGAEEYARRVLPSPSGTLLAAISSLLSQVRSPEERDSPDEELAESALGLMTRELGQLNIIEERGPETADEANALIAAADEWISLASSICARVYAPASPSPEKLLKWSRKVAERLREICSTIQGAIGAAARLINASGWTVAVNFPWGVSLGLDFDSGLAATIQPEKLSSEASEVEELRRQLTATQKDLVTTMQQILNLTAPHPVITSRDDPTTP